MTWFDADSIIAADQFFMPVPVGDVMADGRADFALGAELANYYWVPGSTQRLSGELDAGAAFATIRCADDECSVPPSNAGDLNGDGADDRLTTSMHRVSSDQTGQSFDSPQIHIHYGTPRVTLEEPVR